MQATEEEEEEEEMDLYWTLTGEHYIETRHLFILHSTMTIMCIDEDKNTEC